MSMQNLIRIRIGGDKMPVTKDYFFRFCGKGFFFIAIMLLNILFVNKMLAKSIGLLPKENFLI